MISLVTSTGTQLALRGTLARGLVLCAQCLAQCEGRRTHSPQLKYLSPACCKSSITQSLSQAPADTSWLFCVQQAYLETPFPSIYIPSGWDNRAGGRGGHDSWPHHIHCAPESAEGCTGATPHAQGPATGMTGLTDTTQTLLVSFRGVGIGNF